MSFTAADFDLETSMVGLLPIFGIHHKPTGITYYELQYVKMALSMAFYVGREATLNNATAIKQLQAAFINKTNQLDSLQDVDNKVINELDLVFPLSSAITKEFSEALLDLTTKRRDFLGVSDLVVKQTIPLDLKFLELFLSRVDEIQITLIKSGTLIGPQFLSLAPKHYSMTASKVFRARVEMNPGRNASKPYWITRQHLAEFFGKFSKDLITSPNLRLFLLKDPSIQEDKQLLIPRSGQDIDVDRFAQYLVPNKELMKLKSQKFPPRASTSKSDREIRVLRTLVSCIHILFSISIKEVEKLSIKLPNAVLTTAGKIQESKEQAPKSSAKSAGITSPAKPAGTALPTPPAKPAGITPPAEPAGAALPTPLAKGGEEKRPDVPKISQILTQNPDVAPIIEQMFMVQLGVMINEIADKLKQTQANLVSGGGGINVDNPRAGETSRLSRGLGSHRTLRGNVGKGNIRASAPSRVRKPTGFKLRQGCAWHDGNMCGCDNTHTARVASIHL